MNHIQTAVLVFTTAAFFFDIRTYRIPNVLILTGLFTGLILQLYMNSLAGIILFTGGAVVPFLLFPLFRLRMIGAGDIKLFMMCGCFLGPAASLDLMICSLLVSGIFSVIIIFTSGILRERIRYFISFMTDRDPEPDRSYIVKGDNPENFHLSVPVLITVILFCAGSFDPGHFFI